MKESKEMFKKAKDNIMEAVFMFFVMMILKILMIILTVGNSIKYFGDQEIVSGVIYTVLAIIWGSLAFFEIKLLILKITHELKGLELLNQLNESKLKIYEMENDLETEVEE